MSGRRKKKSAIFVLACVVHKVSSYIKASIHQHAEPALTFYHNLTNQKPVIRLFIFALFLSFFLVTSGFKD